jgi:hypothetical protein
MEELRDECESVLQNGDELVSHETLMSSANSIVEQCRELNLRQTEVDIPQATSQPAKVALESSSNNVRVHKDQVLTKPLGQLSKSAKISLNLSADVGTSEERVPMNFEESCRSRPWRVERPPLDERVPVNVEDPYGSGFMGKGYVASRFLNPAKTNDQLTVTIDDRFGIGRAMDEVRKFVNSSQAPDIAEYTIVAHDLIPQPVRDKDRERTALLAAFKFETLVLNLGSKPQNVKTLLPGEARMTALAGVLKPGQILVVRSYSR